MLNTYVKKIKGDFFIYILVLINIFKYKTTLFKIFYYFILNDYILRYYYKNIIGSNQLLCMKTNYFFIISTDLLLCFKNIFENLNIYIYIYIYIYLIFSYHFDLLMSKIIFFI
jgi:hypothetical protein